MHVQAQLWLCPCLRNFKCGARYTWGLYSSGVLLVSSCLQTFPDSLSASSGPGSSVGIVTDYGMDGPGSNPGGDEIFHQSRPALGPTKPPVQWVPDLSRGKSAAGACC